MKLFYHHCSWDFCKLFSPDTVLFLLNVNKPPPPLLVSLSNSMKFCFKRKQPLHADCHIDMIHWPAAGLWLSPDAESTELVLVSVPLVTGARHTGPLSAPRTTRSRLEVRGLAGGLGPASALPPSKQPRWCLLRVSVTFDRSLLGVFLRDMTISFSKIMETRHILVSYRHSNLVAKWW